MDEPMATLAMQRITDHIDACARNYETLDNSIKTLTRLTTGFIMAVFAATVAFAGWTYAENQSVNAQLMKAQIAASTAASVASTIPDQTAAKVAALKP